MRRLTIILFITAGPLGLLAQEFKSNLSQPAMKYQALRDTDKDPNAALREEGLKAWKQKRDTVLEKAKNIHKQLESQPINK